MPSSEMSRRQFLKLPLASFLASEHQPSHPEQEPRTDDLNAPEIDVPTMAVVVGALVNVAENHNERILDLETRFPKLGPLRSGDGPV